MLGFPRIALRNGPFPVKLSAIREPHIISTSDGSVTEQRNVDGFVGTSSSWALLS